MEILLIILAFILLGAGLIGTLLPIIPGPPLSFAGLLLLQFSGRGDFSAGFLWLWGIITVAVSVADYILPSLMTKRFGGSRPASVGSFLGLIVGTIFFPPFGMIAGSFFGALAGEMIHSRAMDGKTFKVALGSLLAFVLGTGAKLVVCGMMLYYAITAMF